MKGTFRAADFLSLEPFDLKSLCVGDIIAYRRDNINGDPIVHRIIQVGKGNLITKGDNNQRPDIFPISESNLLGKVVAFERGGKTFKVRGGTMGLILARARYVLRRARYLLINKMRRFLPVRRIGNIVFYLWKPKIQKLKFSTAEGPVVKWVYRNSTIATWLPEKNLLKASFLYRFLSTQETE